MSLPLSFLLPPPPASWDSSTGHDIRVHKRIAPVKAGIVEPVGAEFLAVLRRNRYNRTLTQDWELEKALKDSAVDGDDDWVEEPETKALLASDPNNWKHQDHYAILGISRLRWTATDEQIKKAYRKKVLKHHPDKKAATTGKKDDDAYFKCLQKAWEIMTDPALRRQWDSCDPTFDDDLPTAVKKGSTFYETFAPAFEKEARFSKDPAVLRANLGDDSSSREEVEAFYQLWINFDSWRTFEFMDEEEEGGLNSDKSREAKRYLDKKNRAARSRLKKEDNQRVIKFIETAMKLDPRIQKIKEEERAAREAKKYARENAGKKEAEDAAKRAAEVKAAEEASAAEEKERRDVEKKEREAHKKLARKARNAIKAVFSGNNFFLDVKAKPAALEEQQTKFDALIETLELWQLEEFKERLDDAVSGGIAALNAVLISEHELLNSRKEAEAAAAATKASGRSNANSSATAAKKAKAPWSTKEVSTLVKAVKTFPGGTVSRWEKVAEYVNLHGVDSPADSNDRGPDECIKKSKEMQDASVAERTALQSAATEASKKKDTMLNEKPSDRTEVNSDLATPAGSAKAAKPAVASSTTAGGFVLPENDMWSAAQQAALEEGLKKYPAIQFNSAPAKRWEEIAKEVDGKNVKEVKQRMKDLADALAKSKKPAGKSGKK
ncbi:DnaJ (Hsp40), sub C, member 2 [Physocladia obscura]|uniref:DnaJ (Hsp40), sub C, member 2 n=1 Tax=Physocladia obscura TaxID=109957 RepID=A0AAD5XH96_9FUNG|nr:DnaJ (Hsp40), sub C, member 2 [Physocladia obscura]